MTHTLYSGLEWLSRPNPDFATRCKGLEAEKDPGRVIQELANAALDVNQLGRLGRAVTRVSLKRQDLAPLKTFKLGVIGNGTLDLLVPALIASAARYGFLLEVTKAQYNQILSEALSPDSDI